MKAIGFRDVNSNFDISLRNSRQWARIANQSLTNFDVFYSIDGKDRAFAGMEGASSKTCPCGHP